MARRGGLYPSCRHNLLTVPPALIQVEIAKLGHVVRGHPQGSSSIVSPLWISSPGGSRDTEWTKKMLAGERRRSHAGGFLENRREQVRGSGVIVPVGTRLSRHRPIQDELHPVSGLFRLLPRI